jgi:PST family polysaccharide transporter
MSPEKSQEIIPQGQRILSSAGWSFAAKFTRQFYQLIFQIILARVLSPEDFGMLGMILVFSALADILKNMGLGSALIQRSDINDDHLSTVFWINVATGHILLIAFQLLAPYIAKFYKLPELENIVRVYAFIYLIGSFNIVQEALLQKHLQFKRLFFIEVASIIIGGTLAMVLAFNNFGVWTLVWQYLTIAIAGCILSWLTSNWRPKFRFNIRSFVNLRKYGSNLMGHDILSFISRNIDNLLIGRFLGAAALGIYSRAYFLMLQPVNLTSQVLARVMFPVFSRMQNDLDALKNTYIKSIRMVAFVVFPAIVYVMIMAEPLIVTLLGNKWIEVAPILQMFCIYALIDTIGITTGWIFKSLGRTDIMFRWAIYSTSITVAAIIIGLQWGIWGVALMYTLAFLIFLWIPGWWLAFRLIDLPLKIMLRNLAPAFVCTICSGLIMAGTYYFFLKSLPPILSCFVVLSIGIPSYWLFSYLMNKSALEYFHNIIRKGVQKIIHSRRKLPKT